MRSSFLGAWCLGLVTSVWACDCGDDPVGQPPGSTCQRAEDCESPLVCDPTSKTCAEGAVCTDNMSCGLGSICGAMGQCEPNVPGGMCTDNSDCVGGERCSGGTCEPPAQEGDPCVVASDCESGLVCDPTPMVCAADVNCTDNGDCGAGAICTGGSCVQNTPGGSCEGRDDCVDGETCLADTCVPGCGGEFYSAESVPPNLMIVMDRSGSMLDEIDGLSKWDIARGATYNLLSTYRNQIYFGLSLFPGTDQSCDEGMRCGAGVVNVPVGPGQEDDISMFLMGAGTCSFRTPIAEELEMLQGYDGLMDTSRPNYIMILTDGQANCGDPVPEVTALRNQNPEVRTFVVGFGGEVDPDQLTDMAVEGGTALPGDPAYYQADNAASLRNVFGSIAGNVLSCDYTLSEVPPDPDLLFVYFDGVEISRDMTQSDGWDHEVGTNQLTFFGDACDALQSGSVQDLTIIYGCPLPPGVGGSDGGVPGGGTDGGRDGGVPDPGADAGPNTCTSCTECGTEACIIPQGQTSGMCGPCESDFDCCLGAICTGGQCIPAL